MQRIDDSTSSGNITHLYHVMEGGRKTMPVLREAPETEFTEDQFNSPKFKKCYTEYALTAHQSCGGGIFHIDKNQILRKDMMAVILEYKIPDENREKIEACIQASLKWGTVKTNKSFAANPGIIPIETLFAPENFTGYYINKPNCNEMEFFSREHLMKVIAEKPGVNNWCDFFQNISDRITQSVEAAKSTDNTKSCNIF